jgi:hypothetical protein
MARHYRALHGPQHDPLTERAARYPHESATPAEYAKSVEGPIREDDDFLERCALAVAIVAICGVVGILIFEGLK